MVRVVCHDPFGSEVPCGHRCSYGETHANGDCPTWHERFRVRSGRGTCQLCR